MARLLVTHTMHFVRGADGGVYVPLTAVAYPFWQRYLGIFDEVCVAARMSRAAHVPQSHARADGPGVSFADLPDFYGPWQYARVRSRLGAMIRRIVDEHDHFCLRVPCWIGTLVWRELLRRGQPYGVEVVGDPRDSLSRGAVRSVVRPVAQWSAVRALKAQCRNAAAAAYVTREALQRRYPAAPGTFTTHYSSIDLGPEAVADQPRADFTAAHRLIFVGTLEVLYKAPDVLLRALAMCSRRDIQLTMVGDGRERPGLERLARELGIADRVAFRGMLPAGAPVRAALDAADVFVLPSRQEGLPRAMIEAMARGLPCIGSTVGGIPELLPPEDLVPPEASDTLARKIEAFLADPTGLAARSRRNLELSREYLIDTLAVRRGEFYRAILKSRQRQQTVSRS